MNKLRDNYKKETGKDPIRIDGLDNERPSMKYVEYLEKKLSTQRVSKTFTAEEVGDMLANKFSTIEEAIHYFDTVD